MYQIFAKYEILIEVSFLFILTLDVKKEKNNWKLSQTGVYYPSKKKIRENDQNKRFGTY